MTEKKKKKGKKALRANAFNCSTLNRLTIPLSFDHPEGEKKRGNGCVWGRERRGERNGKGNLFSLIQFFTCFSERKE